MAGSSMAAAEKLPSRSYHQHASAYKFPQSVLNALGEEMQGDGFALAARLAEKTGTSIPAPIASLQEKSVRFTDVTAVSGMREAVRRLAGI